MSALRRFIALPAKVFIPGICAMLFVACSHSTLPGAAADSREAAARDYLALATAYLDAGDLEAARRHLENARVMGPDQAQWRHIAALLAAASDQASADETNAAKTSASESSAAEAHFRQALRLDQGNAAIHNNFGVFLHRLGRDEEAAGQFRLAAADLSYPGRAWALENLGRSLLRQQQWPEAREAFEAALAIHGELPVAALELALLHRRASDMASARRVFGEYLEIARIQGLTHSPRALFAGAEFAWHDGNREQVEEFGVILGTLYPDTAEYRALRKMIYGE